MEGLFLILSGWYRFSYGRGTLRSSRGMVLLVIDLSRRIHYYPGAASLISSLAAEGGTRGRDSRRWRGGLTVGVERGFHRFGGLGSPSPVSSALTGGFHCRSPYVCPDVPASLIVSTSKVRRSVPGRSGGTGTLRLVKYDGTPR